MASEIPAPLPRRNESLDGHNDYQYENERYYGQYARYEIHCSMLRDRYRCATYRQAIDKHAAEHFAGKAVMDVGCGTGILSCFAARAGARVVYAIEASPMAAEASLVAARNGFGDVIKVINCKLEDIDQQVPEKVDVIVSEWMGCFLLFESMLESVLLARDRFLKPGGLMYPRFANMYFAPISYAEFWRANVGFLSDVEGIDLGVIIPSAKDQFTETAWKSMAVPPEVLIAAPQLLRRIDTSTISIAELAALSTTPFSFTVKARAEVSDAHCLSAMPSATPWRTGDPIDFHGFVLWFDCVFGDAGQVEREISDASTSSSGSSDVVLSTKPGIRTHWEQDVCMFPDLAPCCEGDFISGIVQMKRNDDCKRHYDLEWSFRVGSTEIYKYLTL